MRVKEQAVIAEASSSQSSSNSQMIPNVRIFQPSNIVTEEIRFGFLDSTLFKIHGFLDPLIPTHYHSVTTQLLGTAMVQDAVSLLSSGSCDNDSAASATATATATDGVVVTRLDYGDFVRIVGKDAEE